MKFKPMHGKLLILTGIIHIIGTILPGVFGEQFFKFAGIGFFNINKGIVTFPLLGGRIDYVVFAAFWFFYAGLFMLIMGLFIDYIERIKKYVPLYLALCFLIFSMIGSYMIPLSGMTFLLIPQGIFMLIRTIKINRAKTEVVLTSRAQDK